jgi:CPA2 family monovalent cation:H+ antiporter-2
MSALASQLAEIGVMLLMFGVGLHFSLGDLMAVRRIAVPGAIVQIAAATALGVATATFWGWDFGAALVFGLALSVASTVVLLRALEDRGVLDSINGRIAVGWLVVEDLVMVLVLVLLPPMAGLLGSGPNVGSGGDVWTTLGITLAKVTAFITLMLLAGRRLLPRLLWLMARTGSRELFTLCVVAVAVGVAYGASALFGVSFALGAFFSGMMMRESEFSHRAAQESLPLRDAFSVLFFVSVGHAVRSASAGRRAAEGLRRGCDHHDRQDGGRDCAGACVPIPAQHGAHGGREPGARSASSRSFSPVSVSPLDCCRPRARA